MGIRMFKRGAPVVEAHEHPADVRPNGIPNGIASAAKQALEESGSGLISVEDLDEDCFDKLVLKAEKSLAKVKAREERWATAHAKL